MFVWSDATRHFCMLKLLLRDLIWSYSRFVILKKKKREKMEWESWQSYSNHTHGYLIKKSHPLCFPLRACCVLRLSSWAVFPSKCSCSTPVPSLIACVSLYPFNWFGVYVIWHVLFLSKTMHYMFSGASYPFYFNLETTLSTIYNKAPLTRKKTYWKFKSLKKIILKV
jgi:hypothetical protein